MSATTCWRPGGESVARRAAGTSAVAADALLNGSCRAFVGLGPPGHHVGWSHGVGWCIYNNAALAPARASTRGALPSAPRDPFIARWELDLGDDLSLDQHEAIDAAAHVPDQYRSCGD